MGKYSHWLNIEPEVENENPVCIKWRELPWVTEEVSDQEHVVLFLSEQEQAKEVIDPKKRELENMGIHREYEYVPEIDSKCIPIRWVITEKLKDKTKLMKVCLVAWGDEENLNNLKTDSPACGQEVLCIVMLTTSVIKWWMESLDFTSAFLQGDKLERDIS